MTESLKEKQSRIGRSNVQRSKRHERRVVKLLSKWAGVEFRRRRVTGRDSSIIERESTADIIPARGIAHFSIEAKCGEAATVDSLLSNPRGTKFTTWWHQTCYDAAILSKAFSRKIWPMMFFKPYPAFDWVAIARGAFADGILRPSKSPYQLATPTVWFPHLLFDAYDYLGMINHNVSHTKKKENKVMVPLLLDAIVLCRWKDFADNVCPRSFFYQMEPSESSNVAVDDEAKGTMSPGE